MSVLRVLVCDVVYGYCMFIYVGHGAVSSCV